jgi:hypothetical protein
VQAFANFLSSHRDRSIAAGARRATIVAVVDLQPAMPATPAACPDCRAKLGLRTLFALGDLWDPRVRSANALRLKFRCYACARELRYPLSTLASFIALAVLPVVAMALVRDFGLGGWSGPIQSLMPPYWMGLGAAYSCLAAPVPGMAARRR